MGDLVQRNDDLFRDGDYDGWSFTENVASAETSNPVKIKPTGRGTTYGTVQLVCAGATAKIQFTLDTFAAIDAETATWTDWDKGEVTGTQTDVFAGPITGLRCVSTSGPVAWKILI